MNLRFAGIDLHGISAGFFQLWEFSVVSSAVRLLDTLLQRFRCVNPFSNIGEGNHPAIVRHGIAANLKYLVALPAAKMKGIRY